MSEPLKCGNCQVSLGEGENVGETEITVLEPSRRRRRKRVECGDDNNDKTDNDEDNLQEEDEDEEESNREITVSIYQALNLIFEKPASPNCMTVLKEGRRFYEGARFRLCAKCSEMLTSLYKCYRDFLRVCTLESEIGQILKALEEKDLKEQEKFGGDGGEVTKKCKSKPAEESDDQDLDDRTRTTGSRQSSREDDEEEEDGNQENRTPSPIVKSEPLENNDNVSDNGDYFGEDDGPNSPIEPQLSLVKQSPPDSDAEEPAQDHFLQQEETCENSPYPNSAEEADPLDDAVAANPEENENENRILREMQKVARPVLTDRVLRSRRSCRIRSKGNYAELGLSSGSDDAGISSPSKRFKRIRRISSENDYDEEEFSEGQNRNRRFSKNRIRKFVPVSSRSKVNSAGSSSSRKCPQCGKKFMHESILLCHRRIVHRDESVKIPKPVTIPQLPFALPKSFSDTIELTSGKIAKCLICEMEIPRHVIQVHLSTHTRSIANPWLCTLCGLEFEDQKSLVEHSSIHKAQTPCSRCGKKVARFEMLGHIRICLASLTRSRGRPRSKLVVGDCKLCGIQFVSKEKMTQHMKLHRQKKKFGCKICLRSFNRMAVLRLHVQRFHRNNEAPPSVLRSRALETGEGKDEPEPGQSEQIKKKPTDGTKKTESGSSADKDTATAQPEIAAFMKDRFSCKPCGLPFPTTKELDGHLMSVHANTETFSCTVCKRSFEDNFCLKLHLKVHSETKPLVCYLCDKVYRDRTNFFDHVHLKHKVEPSVILLKYPNVFQRMCLYRERLGPDKKFRLKPQRKLKGERIKKPPVKGKYPCEVCGKVFPFAQSVKTHTKIVHDKVKEFICSYCGKGFARKHYFMVHERLHASADAPYKCHLCGKGFRMPGTLRMHLQSSIHNPHKSYICDHCGKGFNRADNLRLHVRGVHMKIQIRKPRDPRNVGTGRRRLCDTGVHIRDDNNKYVPNLPIADNKPGTSQQMFLQHQQHSMTAVEQNEASLDSAISQASTEASEHRSLQPFHHPQNLSLGMPILVPHPQNPGGNGSREEFPSTVDHSNAAALGLSFRGFQYR